MEPTSHQKHQKHDTEKHIEKNIERYLQKAPQKYPKGVVLEKVWDQKGHQNQKAFLSRKPSNSCIKRALS